MYIKKSLVAVVAAVLLYVVTVARYEIGLRRLEDRLQKKITADQKGIVTNRLMILDNENYGSSVTLSTKSLLMTDGEFNAFSVSPKSAFFTSQTSTLALDADRLSIITPQDSRIFALPQK